MGPFLLPSLLHLCFIEIILMGLMLSLASLIYLQERYWNTALFTTFKIYFHIAHNLHILSLGIFDCYNYVLWLLWKSNFPTIWRLSVWFTKCIFFLNVSLLCDNFNNCVSQVSIFWGAFFTLILSFNYFFSLSHLYCPLFAFLKHGSVIQKNIHWNQGSSQEKSCFESILRLGLQCGHSQSCFFKQAAYL